MNIISLRHACRATAGVALAAAVMLLFGGCHRQDEKDAISHWLETTRRNTPIVFTHLPEPEHFVPHPYDAAADIDPFNRQRGQRAAAIFTPAASIAADLKRSRCALEAFPLDSIAMVGVMSKPGLSYALLQVEQRIYPARVGDYLGTDLGRIERITETGLELREQVVGNDGQWTERTAQLAMRREKK